jgi:hypothetical protein
VRRDKRINDWKKQRGPGFKVIAAMGFLFGPLLAYQSIIKHFFSLIVMCGHPFLKQASQRCSTWQWV